MASYGTVAEHSRAYLPAGVGDRYEVYVNGVRQEPGRDFDRLGDELVFRRALAQEGRLGPIRWLSMLLGVAGTYRKHEDKGFAPHRPWHPMRRGGTVARPPTARGGR